MAENKPKYLRLDESTTALLDRACGESTSPSDYVSHLIEQAHRKWTLSLDKLRVAGWTGSELLAACDALNGVWLHEYAGGPAFLAAELTDAQRLNDVCGKWDVPPKDWAKRVKALHEDRELQRALVAVVEEFWNGNDELERRLRGAKS